MQFTPKTESQLAEESLLPEGVYNFTVQVAQDKISKANNPMIELQLEVFGEDGRGHKVKDYLMESMGFKLIHFAQSVGLTTAYEKGNMPADIMQGCSGKVKIKIEPAKDNFPPKNAVKDYVKAEAGAEFVAPAKAKPILPRAAEANDASAVPF